MCVYNSPISCFFTYRSLNAIPQCSHSIISWTTHIHTHTFALCGPQPNAQTHTAAHTLAFCSFLCTFSGSLCQTGGPLSSLSVRLCLWFSLSSFFFLYLSPFVTPPELLHCHNDFRQELLLPLQTEKESCKGFLLFSMFVFSISKE